MLGGPSRSTGSYGCGLSLSGAEVVSGGVASKVDLRSPWHWLAFAAILLGFAVFNGLIIGHLPVFAALFHGDRRRWMFFWSTIVGYQWVACLTVLLCVRKSGVGASGIGLVRPSRRNVLVSAAVIALLLTVTIVANPTVWTMRPGFMPQTRPERLFWLLLVSPTAAVCEEVAYRGFLLGFLRTALGLWVAAMLQALMFGFHHGGLDQGVAALSGRVAVGLLFAALALWRKNLLAAIAVHFLIDATA